MQLAVSTSQNHTMLHRRKNVWYSVCDGNWEDPNVWMSNAVDRRANVCPQYGDDVHIMHSVDYSNPYLNVGSWNPATPTAVSSYNYVIGNLFIHQSGKLTATRFTQQNNLIVTGNLQCDGMIDFSTAVSPITLWIKGATNWVNNWSAGTKSTIYYYGLGDYAIMPLTYYNVTIDNNGTKFLTSHLTVNGTLTINGISFATSTPVLELGAFNLTSNLTNVNGTLSKSGSGTVNFNGSLSFTGKILFNSGNPTVNVAGGIALGSDTRNGINLGSTVNITATQTWAFTSSGNVPSSIGNGTFTIGSGVILTIAGISGNQGGWINNGTVNGMDATSILNVDGTYGYGNSNTPMSTGVFNSNHSGTSKIYIVSGVTMTLQQTSFYDLETQGTVTVAGNTTISHNLTIDAGSLQLSIYDFTVSGATSNSGSLLKSGAGTVNFNSYNSPNATGKIDFTAGNPTVNISGHFTGDVRAGLNFGSTTVNILQSINFGMWIGSNLAPTISSNLLIASGKILTNTGLSSTSGGLVLAGTITGADSTAIFDNRSMFTYQNATSPMATGKLYCDEAANTVIYNLGGNQDIQVLSDPTSPGYKNLTLDGGGTKRLLGNVSVKGTYTLVSGTTLNSNGFALTNP